MQDKSTASFPRPLVVWVVLLALLFASALVQTGGTDINAKRLNKATNGTSIQPAP